MGAAADTPREPPDASAKDGARKSERPGRSEAPRELVGSLLSDRYRITRLLGEGGMGAVYEAEHTLMRKRLAVKVLHAEMSRMPEIVARFEREAMAAGNIDHPNVASASDFGKLADGSFFLVLEYVEGMSLRDAIAAGPIEAGRALHVVRQVARAIARAHSLQIVHRDLKPENVMLVSREDDPDFVKVLDFGIAKVPVELLGQTPPPGGVALTRLGMVFGTPEYMAPEQALGQTVDGRADMYSLGVIAFEMLTGTRPFENQNPAALMAMHVTAKIPEMASVAQGLDVPPAAEALVRRMLAKEPDQRFADAKDLAAAVTAVMRDLAAEGKIDPALVDRASASGVMSVRDQSLASNPSFVSSPTRPATPIARGAGASGLAPLLARAKKRAARAMATAQVLARAKPGAALAVVGGLVALTLTVSLGSALSRGSRADTDGPRGRTEGPKTGKPAAAKSDDGLPAARATAEAALSKGDYAAAIASLTSLSQAHPEDAACHFDLSLAYFGGGAEREALGEAKAALGENPSYEGEERLVRYVKHAAMGTEAPVEALDVLESMGAPGADVLYDLAYPAGHAAATGGAHAALQRARLHASDSLAVALDLRAASSCSAKKAQFDRAREAGDARALVILRTLQPTSGCGFLGVRDCWPCMHKDGSLEATIAAIGARTGDASL